MSKTIYFLCPYPFGEAPSQRFRFEQYLDFLKENDFKIEIYPFYSNSSWKTLYSEGKQINKAFGLFVSFIRRFFLLFKLRKADFIFIHREMAHVGPPVFEWIVAKILRRKYIYDFDDAIWLPNFSETNARFQKLKAYWKVNYCMKWAYQITAGNDYLADYARKFNSNVSVIPTTIDTESHHTIMTDHDQERVTIGWTGTHTTMHYLDELVPILKDLEEKYEFDFVVISNEKPQFDLKSLIFVKWNKETEIQDLARINIGLMPLKQDIWSEGKCGFKALQYMALEITTVASPVGVNKVIISNGQNGFLVSDQKDWMEKLIELLENKTLRKKLGKEGKKTIEERYSVKANRDKYLELFKS